MVQFRAFFYKLTETNVLVTQLYKIDTQKLPAVTCTTENPKRKALLFSNAFPKLIIQIELHHIFNIPDKGT